MCCAENVKEQKNKNKYVSSQMENKNIFWIFGILQSVTLGAIIFLIFRSLNMISEVEVIGSDTQIVLCTLFPLFLLIVEYTIYSKD